MKKLYKQFNRLNMDVELKPMEVSDLEKERIKRNVLKQKKRRLPITLSVAVITIVSMFALSLTVSITNPAFAEKLPIIGNIFEIFKEDNEEYIFEEYDDHSIGIGETQESNGVSVTITDAVYDTESITISYAIKSEEPLGDDPFLDGDFIAEEYEGSYTPGRFLFEKISDYEYAGMYIHSLMSGKKHDQVHITWNGEQIRRTLDKQEIEPIKGNWSFEFSIDALEAETQEFEGLFSESEEVRVRLLKMTTTPVSTYFYFTKLADEEFRERDDEWDSIIVDYYVSDNLGNDYNVLYNAGHGDSKYVMRNRFSTTLLEEEATSITITPEVSIYKGDEVIKGPFKLEPIEVPLNQ